jgi:hypothetical protein
MGEAAFVARPHPYQHYFLSPNVLEPLFHLFLTLDDDSA